MIGDVGITRGGYSGSPDFGLVSLAGRPFQFIDSDAEEISGVARQLHMQRQLRSHHRKGNKNGTSRSSSWINSTALEGGPMYIGYNALVDNNGMPATSGKPIIYTLQASGQSSTGYSSSQGRSSLVPASLMRWKITKETAPLSDEAPGIPAPGARLQTVAGSSADGMQMTGSLEVDYKVQNNQLWDEGEPRANENDVLPSSSAEVPLRDERKAEMEQLEAEVEEVMAAAQAGLQATKERLDSSLGERGHTEEPYSIGKNELRGYHFIDLDSYEHEVSLTHQQSRQHDQPEAPDARARRGAAMRSWEPGPPAMPQEGPTRVAAPLSSSSTALSVPVSVAGLPPGSRIVIEVGQASATVAPATSPGYASRALAAPAQPLPRKRWLSSRFQGFVHHLAGPPSLKQPPAARANPQVRLEETPNVLPAIPTRRPVPGSRRVTIQATGSVPVPLMPPAHGTSTDGKTASSSQIQATPIAEGTAEPPGPATADSAAAPPPPDSQPARAEQVLPTIAKEEEGGNQRLRLMPPSEAIAEGPGSGSCPAGCMVPAAACNEAFQPSQQELPAGGSLVPARAPEEDDQRDDGILHMFRATPTDASVAAVQAESNNKQTEAAKSSSAAGIQLPAQSTEATGVAAAAAPLGGSRTEQPREREAVSAAIRADLVQTSSPSGLPLVQHVYIRPAQQAPAKLSKKTLVQRFCPCLQPKTGAQPGRDKAPGSRKWLSKKSNREMVEASLAAAGIQSATVEPEAHAGGSEAPVISVPSPEESRGIRQCGLLEGVMQPVPSTHIAGDSEATGSLAEPLVRQSLPQLSEDVIRWLPQPPQAARPPPSVEYESATEEFQEATSELSGGRKSSDVTLEKGTSPHPVQLEPTKLSQPVASELEAAAEHSPSSELSVGAAEAQPQAAVQAVPYAKPTDTVVYECEGARGEGGVTHPTSDKMELEKLAEEGRSRIRLAAAEVTMKYEGGPSTSEPARPLTILNSLHARLAAIMQPSTESSATPSLPSLHTGESDEELQDAAMGPEAAQPGSPKRQPVSSATTT